MLLTNCPPFILFLEQGLVLMRESGEPMECGIFDFYKVFSRAFGEREDVAGGSYSERGGVVVKGAGFRIAQIRGQRGDARKLCRFWHNQKIT